MVKDSEKRHPRIEHIPERHGRGNKTLISLTMHFQEHVIQNIKNLEMIILTMNDKALALMSIAQCAAK